MTALPAPASDGSPKSRGELYRRTRRSELAIWWREIDRSLLMLVLALMALGAIAVAAASPASARRLSTAETQLDELYFFFKHLRWQLAGLAVLFVTSLLPKDVARRTALVLCAAMLFALLLVPLLGTEVNGARRWLEPGFRFQPSEFLKPGFAVAVAWILSWKVRDPAMPVFAIVTGLMALIAALLMLQPNLGETMLFGATWGALILISGVAIRRLLVVGAGGVTLIVAAYLFYGTARSRIDSFLSGGVAFDQVDLAQRTLMNGGWGGTGFWQGARKFALPEAHTDYIFSVIGEEMGLIACLIVVLVYLAIVLRIVLRLIDEEDLFTVLAGAGLAVQFGGQAFINILVNLKMFPSKGMTLPLLSYGGSSTIALCFAIGLLLAFTRRNPFIRREGFSLSQLGGER